MGKDTLYVRVLRPKDEGYEIQVGSRKKNKGEKPQFVYETLAKGLTWEEAKKQVKDLKATQGYKDYVPALFN